MSWWRRMRAREWGLALGAVLIAGLLVVLATSGATAGARSARAAVAGEPCPGSTFSATRDPTNPLALPTPPGPNPLSGAHFFVDGPAHGNAAMAIEQLLGLPVGPGKYPDSESWSQFDSTTVPAALASNPSAAPQVHLLEKIGNQQETQNISLYSHGGGYNGVFAQVKKLICNNAQADPGSVPVLSTFLVYPNGKFCPTLAELQAWQATFKLLVQAIADALGFDPAVILMEIDAVGDNACLQGNELKLWESDLRYEEQMLSALPHTVTYMEAGAKDEDSVGRVAKILDGICVVAKVNVCSQMRGIWVNGTHFDWSSNEISYANAVSSKLGALIKKQTGTPYTAHVIVNTAQNGRGSKRNPHPVKQGNEDLCNPLGRGLGRLPTGATSPTFDGHSFPLLDGFLWTGVPGRSHNSNCHPGDAAAGVFFSKFALELAANANQQLGPGYPSQPY
ncbi:MAG: glycoside hydrolase family 6 protein [Solirubrobacteraceae bacterium]